MSYLPDSDAALLDDPMPSDQQSSDQKPSGRMRRDLTLCAADYPAQDVEWLWPGRIPIGKVTLLVGDPGNGKSLVALDVTARVSRGGAWPVETARGAGSSNQPPAPSSYPPSSPGSVLILSIEDDLRDTIRPRLDAAGADPSKVFVLPSIDDLRHDLDKLRAALDAVPDCRLIVIDSINAYVGPGDSHFHTIVRRVFKPLAELAAERHLAVLAVSHFRKSEGAAIQQAAGSMGFVAASRAVWTVCRDKTQAGRYLLLPIKNNFAADAAGLAYTIDSVDFSAPKINWQTDTITTPAAEALTPPQLPRGPEAAELNLARKWLREELATGPKSALYLFAEGVVGGGFHERTLRRALDMLGGSTRKTGFVDGWEWSLPNHQVAQVFEPDSSENLSPTVEACPLRKNKHVFEEESCPLRENPDEFDDFDEFELFPSRGPVMSGVEYLLPNSKFAAKPPPT